MSLYREASRRRRLPLVAAGVALVVGLLAGYGIGRATAPEPTIAAALEDVSAELRTTGSALELLTIEYPQGVTDGRVTASTEYEAARADVRRARDAFERARDELEPIAPAATARASRLLASVAALVERKAAANLVEAAARAAERAVRDLPGGRPG
jgi:F0F1-type ATP synthase membrane subunit c/vacuolar-type H+-ATPase subunit K